MKSSTAALAVLVVAALCCQVLSSPAAVNFSGPCCVKYLSKNFPSRHVTMYEYTSIHCPQPGVIFTTFKGKSFCGNPQDEWTVLVPPYPGTQEGVAYP
uniref:Chemokine interleukin-8-like domain-containing protein n=1 Tax=Anser brachyrhynchus TaxID=132585 RepID=A0A8B9BPT7_9AVES